MSSTKQGTGFVAKINTGEMGWRQEFTFDARTKSIRVASLPTLALSNAAEMGLKNGKTLVFRTFNGGKDQVVHSSKDRILNNDDNCLSAKEKKLIEGNTVAWWKCGTETKPVKAQVWKTQWIEEARKGTLKFHKQLVPLSRERFKSEHVPHRKVTNPPPLDAPKPDPRPVEQTNRDEAGAKSYARVIKEGLWSYKFQIRNPDDTEYNMFMSAQEQGNGWVMKMNKQRNGWRSWFIYDHRTRSLRLESDRNLALSNHYVAG